MLQLKILHAATKTLCSQINIKKKKEEEEESRLVLGPRLLHQLPADP